MKSRILPLGAAQDEPRRTASIEPLDAMADRIVRWRRRMERWLLQPLYLVLSIGFAGFAWRVIDGLRDAGVLS